MGLRRQLRHVPARRQLGAHKHLPGNWGPELGFIQDWLANNPTGTLFIGKAVEGGTPLAQSATLPDWSPSSVGELYDKSLFIAHCMQYNLGINALNAIFYFQGEQDATDPTWAADYYVNFNGLLGAWSADVNLDHTTPAMGWGRIYPSTVTPYHQDVRDAQLATDNLTPATVDSFRTWDLTMQADGVHFDEASYVEIGSRFYDLWDGWGF